MVILEYVTRRNRLPLNFIQIYLNKNIYALLTPYKFINQLRNLKFIFVYFCTLWQSDLGVFTIHDFLFQGARFRDVDFVELDEGL